MTSPFPLLHVPYLPQGRIIDFMDPDALVSLSFCSQKSHSVIKTQRKLPFDGHLLVEESDKNSSFLSFPKFVFGLLRKRNCVLSAEKFVDNINYESMESVKMGGQHVRVEMDCLNGYIISYWENTTDGLKVITEYVTNLFNIDISDIRASKQSFHMIEWVNSRQKTPLRRVWYVDWNATSSEEELIYILKFCRPMSELSMHLKPPQNFRFTEKFPIIDCLDIIHGEWMTLDNLLTMDGIDIVLEKTILTSRDLNVFLKHWLAGGCPRLKLFCARLGSVDMFQVLDGLMRNAVFVENSRYYTSPFGYSRVLSGGYDIQREDGVTATVHYQPPRTLIIAVWPETPYNYN
ncbi:hypothetical protein CRE_17598 [Caenorhabditis remanei]|uniref:Uncharacterized protein n=1 Tax=Caenorhabditis remanei TaxID=31234 RepID=E3NF58_CAERE|nr:hypothetical protein CRE_17598 [Caenorhabditis remanei]